MKSIRSKLFLQIGILITVMIALLLVVNTWLAEPYYLYTQQEQMVGFYEQIQSMDDLNNSMAKEMYSSMEQSYGIEVLLVDNEENLIYASSGYQNDDRVSNRIIGPLPELTIEYIRTLDDGTVVSKTTEDNFGIENLLLSNTLDDGSIIELRTTVHYIQTAIKTINEILLITGGAFIVISMIFAYLLAGSFTKPILSINMATKRMQNLDFEVHSEVTTNDELGQLSENINHMSDVLSETIETLHVRDEKRRTLLNNVSHELKTPLTLMQGYAVGLKRNIVNNPEKTDFYTEVIIDETVKMNRLVESLLDIDQLETDKKELNIRTFDILSFIQENTKKFEPVMEEKGVAYTLNSHKLITEQSDSKRVKCDPDLTEQVFKNLMSNAILHSVQPKVIAIEISENEKAIKVCITNSCEWIEEEELNQLWDRFYKKDKARTREQGGHGLGLSIVKAIQEAHQQGYGAKLVDDGVCFWFEVAKA